MTVGDLSDPSAVEKALAEFDRLGRRAFLKKYGYGMAHSWMVVKDGRECDSKAIVGAAHGYEFGEPLRYDEFSGGASGIHLPIQSEVVRHGRGCSLT